jgi:hypothetical protein
MRGVPRIVTALALSAVLGAGAARAQQANGDSAADRSGELFREGRQLLADGRVREACDKFEQSLELRRSPGTLLNIGSCRAAIGDVVGAIDAFAGAVAMAEREPPSDKAQAQIEAGRRELDRVRGRAAHLTVSPPAGEAVRVTLDGVLVERLGVSRPMNPGLHRIEATASSGRRYELDIALKEGEVRLFTIPSLAEPAAAPPPPVAARPEPEPEPTPAQPDHAEPSRPVPHVTWILLGTGGALLAGGAVTGVLTLSRKSELDDRCPGEVCPRNDPELSEARTLATVTDILLGVGAAGVLTGVGFWLFADTSEPSAELGVACSGASRCGVQLDARF